MDQINPVLLWILDHPITWPVIVFCFCVAIGSWLERKRPLVAVPDGIQPSPFPVPTSAEGKPASPKHNVQCIGFKRIEIDPQFPDLSMAALCFQNVPVSGEPIGEFGYARLKVDYHIPSTGERITEVFPAKWFDCHGPSVRIDVTTKCALIALCIGSKWTADRIIEDSEDWRGEFRVECVDLPLGQIKIVATLLGEHNLSIAPVVGILTLGENGAATFNCIA